MQSERELLYDDLTIRLWRADGLDAIKRFGEHLYPTCGFVEVGRQVHFARRL